MDWDRQISAYFDDALSAEEITALFEWLRSNPANAQRFARAAHLHRALLDRFSANTLLDKHVGTTSSDSQGSSMADAMILPALQDPTHAAGGFVSGEAPAPLPFVELRSRKPAVVAQPHSAGFRIHWRPYLRYAAALLILVLGLFAMFSWRRASPARLLAVDGALWTPGSTALAVGEMLPRGDLSLESGCIKLGFDNGNEIILRGPTRFAVQDPLHVTLLQGSLTAVVSTTGRGLRVSTPDAVVTDLGTEFGVSTGDGTTHIAVYKGKVSAAANAGVNASTSQVISAGTRAVATPAGLTAVPLSAIHIPFFRALSFETRRLNLVDLLAGGDGTGNAEGFGIDAATGHTGNLPAVGTRNGNHEYMRITNHRILDGCFIPESTMPVDSAGNVHTFPNTSLTSYGLIWAGSTCPWFELPEINMMLPGEGFSRNPSHVLVMHSNNGFTLNLDSLRAMHGNASLLAFRARVGNSFPDISPASAPRGPFASVEAVVDGVSRFERHGFTNRDQPFDLVCPLTDNDHFLTLATTDGGDGLGWDWVLWTRPEFEIRKPR